MAKLVSFNNLPLGAWFKYPASDREYIKTDHNMVVVPSDIYDDKTQEIYGAFSSDELDHTVEWIKIGGFLVDKEIRDYQSEISRLKTVSDNYYAISVERFEQLNRVKDENLKLRLAATEVVRISDRKHDAWDNLKALLAKCPECGSQDYIQIDREGDMLAPEATYFVCNDCGHASDPE